MTALARFALLSLVSFGSIALAAPAAEASSVCAKKKKKSKKKKAAAPKAVTAETLLKWRRAGMTDDEVAARAISAGYVLTEKDKTKLKKAKARTLIGALEGSSGSEDEGEDQEMIAGETKAAPSSKPININKITAPEDIDFDDVPPPSGVPSKYATAKKEPEKKKLDTSTRPSAAFEEEKEKPAQVAATSPSKKTSSAPSTASSSPEPGKKRVVYTAAAQ